MIPYKTYRLGAYVTSEIEIRDIIVAWFVLSLCFAVLFVGFSFTYTFLQATLFSAITAGIGFLLHEMGHKIVAQRYGCFAEFRANYFMLFLAIIMSFFGFLFAAPGAVMIAGHVDKRKNGIISVAGPLVNIVLSLLFFVLFFIKPTQLFSYGYSINAWLGLFNMLPLPIFDGVKVLAWNKAIYGIVLLSAAILVFASFLITIP